MIDYEGSDARQQGLLACWRQRKLAPTQCNCLCGKYTSGARSIGRTSRKKQYDKVKLLIEGMGVASQGTQERNGEQKEEAG